MQGRPRTSPAGRRAPARRGGQDVQGDFLLLGRTLGGVPSTAGFPAPREGECRGGVGLSQRTRRPSEVGRPGPGGAEGSQRVCQRASEWSSLRNARVYCSPSHSQQDRAGREQAAVPTARDLSYTPPTWHESGARRAGSTGTRGDPKTGAVGSQRALRTGTVTVTGSRGALQRAVRGRVHKH